MCDSRCAPQLLQKQLFLVISLLLLFIGSNTHSVMADDTALTPLVNLSRPLNLAWLGPLQSGSSNTLLQGHPGLVGFRMALSEASQDPLYANTPIIAQIGQTMSTPAKTITTTYDLIQNGAIAIVGEYLSGLATVEQYVAASFSVVQISPSATALEFTTQHASTFPYFMRNVPQVGLQAGQMASLVQKLGWKRVGVIYTSDAFGAGGATQFTKFAVQLGIEITVSVSFNIGDTDVSFQLNRLIDSDSRIIVYWGLIGDLRTVWYSASNMNIVSTDLLGEGYQWILNHGVTTSAMELDSLGKSDPNMIQWAKGQIGLQYYIDHSTPEFQAFQTRFRNWPYSNETSSVHPDDTVVGVPIYTSYTYDATWQMIRAMRRMVYELGVDPTLKSNRALFYQVCLNVTFNGVTGKVVTDSFGDRQTSFGLVNYKRDGTGWNFVGHMNNDGTVSLDPGAKFEYAGSDPDVQPPDTTPRGRVILPRTSKIAVLTVCSIIMLLLFGVQVSIYVKREQPSLKSASPRFLRLYILGVQLLCASVIPRALESEADIGATWPCAADLWLTNLGYTLLIGSLLLKTMRLSMIFNQTQLNKITSLSDEKLLFALSQFVVVETALLLGLEFGAPTQVQLRTFDSANDFRVCYNKDSTASTDTLNSVYLPATISTRFALLLVTVVCVFRVRNIPDAFNESKQLGLTIYNLFFLSALLPAIDIAVGRSSNSAVSAYSSCVFLICILSVCIIMVPKFFAPTFAAPHRKDHVYSLNHHTQMGNAPASGWTEPDSKNHHPTELIHTNGTRLSVTSPTLASQVALVAPAPLAAPPSRTHNHNHSHGAIHPPNAVVIHAPTPSITTEPTP